MSALGGSCMCSHETHAHMRTQAAAARPWRVAAASRWGSGMSRHGHAAATLAQLHGAGVAAASQPLRVRRGGHAKPCSCQPGAATAANNKHTCTHMDAAARRWRGSHLQPFRLEAAATPSHAAATLAPPRLQRTNTHARMPGRSCVALVWQLPPPLQQLATATPSDTAASLPALCTRAHVAAAATRLGGMHPRRRTAWLQQIHVPATTAARPAASARSCCTAHRAARSWVFCCCCLYMFSM